MSIATKAVEVVAKSGTVAKALLAGGIALVGGIAVGYADDVLTKGEFWAALAAGLAAVGVVFRVPNGERELGEDGAVDPGSAALGALVGLVVMYLILR